MVDQMALEPPAEVRLADRDLKGLASTHVNASQSRELDPVSRTR